MKLLDQLLDELFAPNEAQAMDAFNQRLEKLGIEGVHVSDVSVEYGGDAVVTFRDEDNSEMDILFTYDEEEGAVAINLDDRQDYFDDEADDIDLVDLDPLEPKMLDYGDGNIGFDLLDLKWLNADAVIAIVNIGDFLDVPDQEGSENVSEAMTTVIRGGKRVRVPLVRRRRRKRLSSRQRAAIRKGVRTRKKKKAQISRKLKKSLKFRKRLGIKQSSTKSHKVAGTSDRKRR